MALLDKIIISNIGYTFVLRILSVLVPILTFPHIANSLGLENYGVYIWIWTIANFFVVFTRFGFDITSARELAMNIASQYKIENIIANTIVSKIMLGLVSCIIFSLATLVFDELKTKFDLVFASMLMIVGEALLPYWYFLGTEKLKVVSLFSVSAKLVFTIFVFMLVDNSSSPTLVMLIFGLVSIFISVLSLLVLYFDSKITTFTVSLELVETKIKSSFSIYLSGSVSVFKDFMTIMVLDKFVGNEGVAVYDLVNRVLSLLITPFHVVYTALFPRFVKYFNFIKLSMVIKLSVIISLVSLLFSIGFQDYIASYLGIANEFIFFYSVMVSMIVVLALSSCLGTLGLMAIGSNDLMLYSSFISLCLYLCGLLVTSLIMRLDLVSVAMCLFAAAFFESVIRLFFLKSRI